MKSGGFKDRRIFQTKPYGDGLRCLWGEDPYIQAISRVIGGHMDLVESQKKLTITDYKMLSIRVK